MDDDNDLRGLPALLSAIADGTIQPPQDLARDTAAYLLSRTIVAAGTDAEASLQPALQHPGYLTRQVGGRDIYVPFNLASVFPGADMVDDVIRIADAISLHPDDPVCISGSTTFLGAIDRIGDLDFCEYYVSDPDGLPADALGVADAEETPLVWLKCGGRNLKGPWEERRAEVEANLQGSSEKRIKLDFVSNGRLGLMPTTSVIIATTDDDVAAQHSFAYQEAVVAGRTPIRNLVSPERFGDYVNWLRREVRRLATPTGARDGYPIKALKRALSLLLIIDREGDTSNLLEKLHESELSTIVLQVRVAELERMLGDLPDGIANRFIAPLHELKECFDEVTDDEIDQALEAAGELALASLALVEEEFRTYG